MRVYKFRVNDDTKYFIEGMVEIESLGKLALAYNDNLFSA